ncbi:MAG: DUF5074 domain-containing protein [Bacteroidales bacterium]|nr:DUF5074 domain-containing protein [Bacteroidales bacterium]
MKKSLLYLLLALLFVGCSDYDDDINSLNQKYEEVLEEQIRQAEALKNHETLLAALQNQLTIDKVEATDNGYEIIFSDNTTVDITNGHTPVFTLGENGNWFIDGEDAGIAAEGSTPTIVDGYWHIDGESTGVKAEPQDGTSAPTITSIVIQDGVAVFTFSDESQIEVPIKEETTAFDFSKGFFIVNEGQFGKGGGVVNFYNSITNKVDTNLFVKINPGKDLGNTTQFATIYNEQMYLVSKQGDLVTANPNTLVETGRIKDFNKEAADGHAFCGVTAELGLVSTTKGIFKLNLSPLSLGDKIEGITGTIGELLQYREHVYAVGNNKIYVLNTNTWEVDKTFDNGKSGLTVSKDGMIWSTHDNLLLKINPYTLEMNTIAMPNDIKTTNNPWAWTQGSLTASKQENALFFVSGMNIYKYVIGDIASLNSPLFTVPSGRMIYGTGMSVDPKSNQVLVTTIDGYGLDSAKNNLYFYDGTTGTLKKNLFYEGMWFPSMILFPEN